MVDLRKTQKVEISLLVLQKRQKSTTLEGIHQRVDLEMDLLKVCENGRDLQPKNRYRSSTN